MQVRIIKNLKLFTIFIILLFQFSFSSLRIGYEIDMRPKTISTRQNLFLDYKLSEKYRIRLIFNDVDFNKDLFEGKIHMRTRLYYIPTKNDQFFITLGKDFKSLAYTKKFEKYEIEITSAIRRNKFNLDLATRLNISDNFSIKIGCQNIFSKNREFYIRPRFLFNIKI